MELIVILDNIRSAFNVGAILRTCDGAGVKKVYLCGYTPTPENKKVLKTSLGAENMVEWEYKKSTEELIEEARKEGFDIVSVEISETSQDYSKYQFKNKTALIFGNEIAGVSPTIMQKSDVTVHLPMKGQKESLNVATTAGILIYHVSFVA